MFDKLVDLEQKFVRLSEEMANPDVLADSNRFRAVAKEQAELKDLVAAFRQYRTAKQQLDESKQLLQDENDEGLRDMVKLEIPLLQDKISKLEEELKLLLLPKDPNDSKNIIVEIRAGTGGEEAALFAAELFRMYQRFAELKKWHVEVIDIQETGLGGAREIIAEISGKEVFSYLKYESGTHRVQRIPQTETQGRVHTSAVTVAIMPEAEEVDIEINPADLRIDTFRSGGAGGQHVNKTDSAVRITHIPTNTVVVCQDQRSQHKNKAKAMTVLRSRMYDVEMQKQASSQASSRKEQVGSGDRSEKIRTYNFPQNRLTDHRIGYTNYNLPVFMNGEIEDLILALRTHYQTEALKAEQVR